FSTFTVTDVADYIFFNRDCFSRAEDSLIKSNRHRILEIVTFSRSIRISLAAAAEKRTEDIFKTAKAAGTAESSTAAEAALGIHTLMSETVVLRTLIVVRQHFIRFRYLFKFFIRPVFHVRVIFL